MRCCRLMLTINAPDDNAYSRIYDLLSADKETETEILVDLYNSAARQMCRYGFRQTIYEIIAPVLPDELLRVDLC